MASPNKIAFKTILVVGFLVLLIAVRLSGCEATAICSDGSYSWSANHRGTWIERVMIAVPPIDAGGQVSDPLGKFAVRLNELAGCPFIAILDHNRQGGTVLAAGSAGPFLAMYDKNGEVRAQMDLMDQVQRVMLHDAHGKVRAVLAVTEDGPLLSFWDADGKLAHTIPGSE